MKKRPIGPLVDALRANGSEIDYLESQGCLPLSIAPAGLKGSRIQLAASVSSQYVSSILLCAPYAPEPVILELTGGQVISQPCIDMTIVRMKTFGVDAVRKTDPETGKLLDIYETPRAVYKNPPGYNTESDASSMTYFLSLTYPDIKLALLHIDEITTGADALELRVATKISLIKSDHTSHPRRTLSASSPPPSHPVHRPNCISGWFLP